MSGRLVPYTHWTMRLCVRLHTFDAWMRGQWAKVKAQRKGASEC